MPNSGAPSLQDIFSGNAAAPTQASSPSIVGKPSLNQIFTPGVFNPKTNPPSTSVWNPNSPNSQFVQPGSPKPGTSMASKVMGSLASGLGQAAKSLVKPIVGGAKEVANDTSQAFQGGIGQIKQGASEFGKNKGDFIGPTLKMGAGVVNTALSPLAAPFKPVSNAINYAADKTASIPQVQNFANSKAGQITAQAMEPIANTGTIAQGALAVAGAPEAIEKGNAVLDRTGQAAKPGLNAVKNDIVGAGQKVASTAGKVSDTAAASAKAVRQGISPTLSPEEAAGQVIQGQTSDVPAAQRTLSSIDTKGVKTYSDLQSKLNSHVNTLSKAQDALLSADGRTFKIQQLATKVGDTGVAHNYVNDALTQLKDYFAKTNDVANLQKVNDWMAKTNPTKGPGLTLQDVNSMAKMHGSKLNAFNANGELASGLSKVAAENTRMGLKNTVRNLLPNDLSKTIDAHISDALDTKKLIDKQVEKVNAAAQKTPKQGVVPKTVSKIIKGVDFVTGNPLKAIGKEMGTAGSSGVLSPTEIEGNLPKNLKAIKNAK